MHVIVRINNGVCLGGYYAGHIEQFDADASGAVGRAEGEQVYVKRYEPPGVKPGSPMSPGSLHHGHLMDQAHMGLRLVVIVT